MTDKIKTGREGEDIAAEFLERAGYAITARNFKFGPAEIDLIAEKDNWLVFVEVKFRTSDWFGPPETFVNRNQRSSIRRAAGQYIFNRSWDGHVRFDVVSITRIRGKEDILHITDAFY